MIWGKLNIFLDLSFPTGRTSILTPAKDSPQGTCEDCRICSCNWGVKKKEVGEEQWKQADQQKRGGMEPGDKDDGQAALRSRGLNRGHLMLDIGCH